MPERRPFPPSPRRRALARQAGLTGASPLLVGAAAVGAAAAASVMLARSAATQVGGWIAAACDGRAVLAPVGMLHAVLAIALPLLGIAALAAIAVHVAQTRGVWLPRRRIEDAPGLPAGAGPRTAAAAFELVGAAVVGVCAFGWLWLTAPRLASLFDAPVAQAAVAVAAFVATIAIAWVALGVVDALLRHAAVGRALSMTAEEKRQDERLSAADPRWRALRRKLSGPEPAREAIAKATLLLLGDDVAVAIAWDAARQPAPTIVAHGTGARATQLLAHARRQALPVHRDAALAAALPTVGTVPEASWPRLAEIIAAVRR
jgi:flagellar biosynthetic protein FlhB